jgi:hypothetical protein
MIHIYSKIIVMCASITIIMTLIPITISLLITTTIIMIIPYLLHYHLGKFN